MRHLLLYFLTGTGLVLAAGALVLLAEQAWQFLKWGARRWGARVEGEEEPQTAQGVAYLDTDGSEVYAMTSTL